MFAFLLPARLELVAAGVEGVGKGKGRRVHRLLHVLQPLPFSVSNPEAKCIEVEQHCADESRPKSELSSCQR